MGLKEIYMKEIKSDILIAQQLGAALKTGAEALISIAGAYKDEQTKLLGNDSAHHAIALSQNKAKVISAAIQSVCTNIQSVAEEFQASDEASASRFQLMEGRDRE